MVNRVLQEAIEFDSRGFSELDDDSDGGHPREERRERYSAIACGLRTANAFSTLSSTAAMSRHHWGCDLETEATMSSVFLRWSTAVSSRP